MNVLSLPLGVIKIGARFEQSHKLKLANSMMTKIELFDYVWGINVHSELKSIEIEYFTKKNASAYHTSKYTFEGDYCLVAVNDEKVLTITVDEFKKLGE